MILNRVDRIRNWPCYLLAGDGETNNLFGNSVANRW
jgi:hypothetical protein